MRKVKMRKGTIVFIGIIIGIILCGAILCKEETIKVSIKPDEIDATFTVASIENKFTEIKLVALGGAGTGGLASTAITTDTPEKFNAIIPANAIIYKVVEEYPNGIVKKFVAFSGNQVFIYEDSYFINGFFVDKYVPEEYVVFYKNNYFDVAFVEFLVLLALVIGFALWRGENSC